MRVHRVMYRYVLMEHGAVCILSAWNISGSILRRKSARTTRNADVKMFNNEKTLGVNHR